MTTEITTEEWNRRCTESFNRGREEGIQVGERIASTIDAVPVEINPSSDDYTAGFHAGFSAANEIIKFAQNVNLLIEAITESPMTALLVQGNPKAKAAMKRLKDND